MLGGRGRGIPAKATQAGRRVPPVQSHGACSTRPDDGMRKMCSELQMDVDGDLEWIDEDWRSQFFLVFFFFLPNGPVNSVLVESYFHIIDQLTLS